MNIHREEEPLLLNDENRFTQLPLKYPDIQNAYEKHEACFWTAKEIDYVADLKDWEKLSDNEKYFIEKNMRDLKKNGILYKSYFVLGSLSIKCGNFAEANKYFKKSFLLKKSFFKTSVYLFFVTSFPNLFRKFLIHFGK